MHASRNLAISNKIAEVGERRFSQSSVQTLSGRKVANLFEQAIVSVPFADLNADCVGQARHGLQLPKLRCHGIGMIDKDAAPHDRDTPSCFTLSTFLAISDNRNCRNIVISIMGHRPALFIYLSPTMAITKFNEASGVGLGGPGTPDWLLTRGPTTPIGRIRWKGSRQVEKDKTPASLAIDACLSRSFDFGTASVTGILF
ncbi:uncharacterized protein BO96DRAFT_435214 [Aspergillus niger CBS 101883]|uniref:uncharacterized protein n=1 Tax=Aspergillus lacticoffeatus (strain CBS 101883) TaxID=1450533 RepID=UPI000D7FF3BF|nr:uncharacterized protein BO96DRAFT_435214 [Aspergillus niger CBS 101883]PYH55348.1 hypothetical protein BO96DRAFT_435214 [Aspergillus niger CBS 101883]